MRKRKCRVCGCTDERACPGGCTWLPIAHDDLCSACEPAAAHVVSMTLEHIDAGKSFHVATCACGWTRRAKRTQEAARALDDFVRLHCQAAVCAPEHRDA